MTEICPICSNTVEDGLAECPHCGFKMLGATQSFKPLGAEPEQVRPVKHEAASITLKVLHGPQDSAEFEVEEGAYIIGRNPNSDIFLNHMTVSRKHATLDRIGDECTIRDEKSFNGVWVNNQSVEKYHLRSGDIIQIGAFELLYQVK